MSFSYKSFYWSLGTTSFRTKNFNKRIELQLALLKKFWELDANADKEWSESNGVQTAYYDFLHANGFLYGAAKNKAKDAREKTSGLVTLGLIGSDRRLTEVGHKLLEYSENNNFTTDNLFRIPADSFIYLRQLLKTSVRLEENVVRPFVVTAFLLSKFGSLSIREFTYLLPLAADRDSTLKIAAQIDALRKNELHLDEIIFNRLMELDNYCAALKFFLEVPEVSLDTITTIGMNRKSRSYDSVYFPLYIALHRFYLEHDDNAIYDVVAAMSVLKGARQLWQQYLFGSSSLRVIRNAPVQHLRHNGFDTANNESEFRSIFFAVLHVIKAKIGMADYCDLNRRYLKTSDIILFADDAVTLDVIPRHYFAAISKRLLDIAFEPSPFLEQNCSLAEISPLLAPNEDAVIAGINKEFALKLRSLHEATEILDHQRYIRLTHLIDSKFTDEKILLILNLIERREDSEIQQLVTDNADIPTIFEYVLGILWYKISGRQGKILDYMKLSLDADLLPKTHAAGGDADIVYEYEASTAYPAHSLLLEATLTDRNNQRRMEMEPVSRHLGNHILKTGNPHSYCVFATNNLNINVVSDFRSRKNHRYYDVNDESRFIDGMKIIPLQIDDLKHVIENRIDYSTLYELFETAFQSELPPYEWLQRLAALLH